MTATLAQLAQLRAVNDRCNSVAYNASGLDSREDVWRAEPVAGEVWECRDYTEDKAEQLREAGWPLLDMFIVLCYIESEPAQGIVQGEASSYHAVLGCRAGTDIYILDNRWPDVYLWNQPPYRYLWAHQQVPGQLDAEGRLVWRDASAGLI